MKTTAYALLVSTIVAAASAASEPSPLVGVYYFPGWYRGRAESTNNSSEWRRCIMKTPVPRPLCGFYDDADPRLWSYYIDWMTRYGVDFFAFDWYYNAGQRLLEESLEKGFLGCESNRRVRFALHWCNHPLGGLKLDQRRPELLRMMDLASDRYFKRSNYLRLEGRPVFMIYDIDQLLAFGGLNEVKASLKEMRRRAARHGHGGLYLVAVYSRVSASFIRLCRDLGFDAFCAYTYVGVRYPPLRWDSQNIPYETCVANCLENIYPFLSRVGREKDIPYWPTAFPGWDDRPRAGVEKAFVTEGNTPPQFGTMFRGALKFVDPTSPIVMVEAWNEWGEGACIEPDHQFGFGYLEEIARAIGRNPGTPRVPSAEEITSWSVLTPSEVEAAKSIEGLPWQPKRPIYLDPGKNRAVPKVKLPMTIDLCAGPAKIHAWGGRIERRDAKGLLFVSDSNDPQIIVCTPEIPTSQIRRVTVFADIPDASPQVSASFELFFQTALYPESSAFCSAQLGPLRSRRVSVATSEIMGWEKFGTPLTAIRIDPAQQPGARVLLRKIRLD